MSARDYIRLPGMKRLTDPVAIVTGAGRGMGGGIASVLAAEGARVVLCDLNGDLAESTATELRVQGLDVVVSTTDVTSRTSVEAMVERVFAEHGRIDVVAANAGIYPVADLGEIDDGHWDQVMDVNVKGAVRVVQACAPSIVSRGYGRIVLPSSIPGPVTGQPGFAAYGASKAAMLGFMRSVAVELAASGVTINAVLPGNVATPGFA